MVREVRYEIHDYYAFELNSTVQSNTTQYNLIQYNTINNDLHGSTHSTNFRLHVYGVDFRNLVALEWFCTYIIENYDRLDAIVNNAAQTVRRPPAYYAHLVEAEKMIGYTAHSNNESKDNENENENENEVLSANDNDEINNDINKNRNNRNDNNSCSSSGSSSSSSSSNSCSSSNDNRMRQSLNTILHHQKIFTSSLSHAVESAQSPVPLGAITDSDSDRSNAGTTREMGGGGVISEIPPERTDTTHQNTVLTPAMSSSEMTQIILTKVGTILCQLYTF